MYTNCYVVWKAKSEERGCICTLLSGKPNLRKRVTCILCDLKNQIWKKGLHLYYVVWKTKSEKRGCKWSFQRAVFCQRFHCIFLVCCLLVPVFVIWTVRTLCHSLQAVLGSKDWRAFFIHIRFMLNTVNVYAWNNIQVVLVTRCEHHSGGSPLQPPLSETLMWCKNSNCLSCTPHNYGGAECPWFLGNWLLLAMEVNVVLNLEQKESHQAHVISFELALTPHGVFGLAIVL